MGHDILDQPSLGVRGLALSYRRVGEGIGMDPTVSDTVTDRDRLDWLERCVGQIRGVLDDSGYGKLLGKVTDTAETIEVVQLLLADLTRSAGEQMTELKRLVESDTQRHGWLEQRVAALETQAREQAAATQEALAQVIAEIADLRAILTRKPWWKFWSKD